MKKKIIIDCDPGYDDALALILAFGNENLDIEAVTTCAGNQTVEKTFRNALNILSYIKKEAIVAKGAVKPLVRELEIAAEVHGETGLDGTGLEEGFLKGSEINAVELMRDILLKSEEKVTIVVTGPLTNVALLLSQYPWVKEKIEEISFMGGACFGGNVTPSAEYNMNTDPEAGEIVLSSGVRTIMCGLDVTHKALLMPEDFEKIKSVGNKTAELAWKVLKAYSKFYEEHTELVGVPVHDACAVAYVINPEMFHGHLCNVTVETAGKYTTGQTVVDYRDLLKKEKNTKVLMEIKKDDFLQMLLQSIGNLP